MPSQTPGAMPIRGAGAARILTYAKAVDRLAGLGLGDSELCKQALEFSSMDEAAAAELLRQWNQGGGPVLAALEDDGNVADDEDGPAESPGRSTTIEAFGRTIHTRAGLSISIPPNERASGSGAGASRQCHSPAPLAHPACAAADVSPMCWRGAP